MKHKTYETLYQAHLGNVNRDAIEEARAEETDPFFHNLIDLVLEKKTPKVEWNVLSFTDDFRSGDPRERLDETAAAFLLRIAAIHKEEQYMRAFRKPGSFDALMAWEALLRDAVLCSLALLYGVRWTAETVFGFLEPAVLRLLGGESHPQALRELLKSVGVAPARETPYQAEVEFARLNMLYLGQFSSMYWRFLHWMAEAYDLRKDPGMKFFRDRWLELLQKPVYRTLRCGVCMYHYQSMVRESRARLADPGLDLPRLLFEWHNRVHALRRDQAPFLQEPDHAESEFEKDRQFMRRALE